MSVGQQPNLSTPSLKTLATSVLLSNENFSFKAAVGKAKNFPSGMVNNFGPRLTN